MNFRYIAIHHKFDQLQGEQLGALLCIILKKSYAERSQAQCIWYVTYIAMLQNGGVSVGLWRGLVSRGKVQSENHYPKVVRRVIERNARTYPRASWQQQNPTKRS